MKLLLFGKNIKNIEPLAKELGFEIVEESPDVVVSYGGDGTLLSSEREFPEVSKLPIRDSAKCIKCVNHTDQALLEHLKAGSLKLEEHPKLEANFLGNSLYALNDFVIRNSTPVHAVRFNLYKNGQATSDELIIGDGLVFSTAFGSTGYFSSITRKSFTSGFAVAFNNTVSETDALHFREKDKFMVKIVRGPAALSVDNNHAIYDLENDSQIEIFPSDKKAKIYEINTLRCLECQVIREKH